MGGAASVRTSLPSELRPETGKTQLGLHESASTAVKDAPSAMQSSASMAKGGRCSAWRTPGWGAGPSQRIALSHWRTYIRVYSYDIIRGQCTSTSKAGWYAYAS